MSIPTFDITIIGTGVVGLAIAKTIAEKRNCSVLIIEKNESFGQETSSRNSEVIHSGIFNPIDSKKYKFCKKGNELLYNFCEENQIWHKKCGKIIVSNKNEIKNFEQFVQSLKEKKIKFEILNSEDTKMIEPNINSYQSVLIKNSGIIDSHSLMNNLFRISNKYHTYIFDSMPIKITKEDNYYKLEIKRKNREIEIVKSNVVINSAGLQSYKIARDIMGNKLKIPKMKFYKGSYFALSSKWRKKFTKLVYSLPKEDDSLGIHISFDSENRSKLGPDYELIEENNFDYSVNQKMDQKFFDSAKEYIDNLKIEDLTADYSGIRPKLFYNSEKFSDFYINEESENGYKNLINLIGIDSPGLTASLAIGEYVNSILS